MAEFDRFARFYDLDYEGFQEDLPLYAGFAERVGGALLEWGCGTGRLLLPVARAGFAITRVERPAWMGRDAWSEVETSGLGGRGMVEVQGALAPGDLVVVRGTERLRPGQAVEVVPPAKGGR